MKKQNVKLEIIFISMDDTEKDCQEFVKDMSWLSIPWSDQIHRRNARNECNISRHPRLVVFRNEEEGFLITDHGKDDIQERGDEAWKYWFYLTHLEERRRRQRAKKQKNRKHTGAEMEEEKEAEKSKKPKTEPAKPPETETEASKPPAAIGPKLSSDKSAIKPPPKATQEKPAEVKLPRRPYTEPETEAAELDRNVR